MQRDPLVATPRLRAVRRRGRLADLAYCIAFAAMLAALMALAVLA